MRGHSHPANPAIAIDSERRGTWVYYRLVPAALERMGALLCAPPARSRLA